MSINLDDLGGEARLTAAKRRHGMMNSCSASEPGRYGICACKCNSRSKRAMSRSRASASVRSAMLRTSHTWRTWAAEEAKAIIRDLFGEGCAKRGLVELNDGIIRALYSLADLIGRGDISAVTVQLPGICKVNMKISGYSIKVERVEGRKYSDVAGEQ